MDEHQYSFLIVDEYQTVRNMIGNTLAVMGIDSYVFASSEREALQILEHNNITFIIADSNSTGANGLNLLKCIRGMKKSIPKKFLLMSSDSERSFIYNAIKSGVDGLIIKPFNQRELIKKIKQLTLSEENKLTRTMNSEGIDLLTEDTDNNKNTILIVDDAPQNIDLISKILRTDYKIKAATSAERALKIISKPPIPDLILLDIMMPEVDGFTLCKLLQDDPVVSGVPIIFLTAKSDIKDITKGFSLGAVDFIKKPTNPAELLSRVKTHLKIYLGRKELQEKLDIAIQNEKLKQQIQHMQRIDINSRTFELMQNMNAYFTTSDTLNKSSFDDRAVIVQLNEFFISTFESLVLYKFEHENAQLRIKSIQLNEVYNRILKIVWEKIEIKKLSHINQIDVRYMINSDLHLAHYALFKFINAIVELSTTGSKLNVSIDNSDGLSMIVKTECIESNIEQIIKTFESITLSDTVHEGVNDLYSAIRASQILDWSISYSKIGPLELALNINFPK